MKPIQQWIYDKGFDDIIVSRRHKHKREDIYVSDVIRLYIKEAIGDECVKKAYDKEPL